MVKLKIIVAVVFVILLIHFIINDFLDVRHSKKAFYKCNYQGIIENIRTGQRGFPVIKINSSWRQLSMPELVIHRKIEIGDSIFKAENSNIIFLHKLDSLNNWIRFKYDTKYGYP